MSITLRPVADSVEGARILIVEDEKSIADGLQAGLAENGYKPSVAYSGEDGYELLSQQSFDLLLLDINLEGMNGFDLCKKIRQHDTNLPIIMLTSMRDLSDKITGYNAGADDYTVKPFEFKELLLKIGALLKRTLPGTNQQPSILKAHNLEMNLDSKEVTRDNIKIPLTVKEFQLLEYLLRNQNKLVTRAEIAMHVWSIDFNTNTNVIDVYISYLRNKIDRNFHPRLIHTHVGMGYILKVNES